MRIIKLLILIVIAATLSAEASAQKANNRYGLFSSFDDIGSPEIAGTVSYDSASKIYRLSGSGSNIWFGSDSFSFLSRKVGGDFSFSSGFRFIGEGIHHRKIGLMVRSSVAPDAKIVCCTVHGDGLTSFQYRDEVGANIKEVKCKLTYGDRVSIVKKGNKYSVKVSNADGQSQSWEHEIDLGADAVAGLFICSHDNKKDEACEYYDVQFKTLK